MRVSLELIVGVGIGLVIAAALSANQNALGQLARLSPCGCVVNVILGLLLIAAGIWLLAVGGYIHFPF